MSERDLLQQALADHATHQRAHDLPQFWDGQKVTWGPWGPNVDRELFICPPPRAVSQVCPHCGAQDDPSRAEGRILVDGSPASRYIRSLIAYRCPLCLHDTVEDWRTGEQWMLDDSDYTDVGSFDPTT